MMYRTDITASVKAGTVVCPQCLEIIILGPSEYDEYGNEYAVLDHPSCFEGPVFVGPRFIYFAD